VRDRRVNKRLNETRKAIEGGGIRERKRRRERTRDEGGRE